MPNIKDDVQPGNIVGAVANEAELESCYIGTIDIHDTFSTIDLPDGMPKETLNTLKKAWVCGKKLDIMPLKGAKASAPKKFKSKPNKGKGKLADKNKPRPRSTD